MTETRSTHPLQFPSGFDPAAARRFLSGEDPRGLMSAFTWAQSPQGHDFWSSQYMRPVRDDVRAILEQWIKDAEEGGGTVSQHELNTLDPAVWDTIERINRTRGRGVLLGFKRSPNFPGTVFVETQQQYGRVLHEVSSPRPGFVRFRGVTMKIKPHSQPGAR